MISLSASIIILVQQTLLHYGSYTVSLRICLHTSVHSRLSIPMYFFAISHARIEFLNGLATTLTTVSQSRLALLNTSVRHFCFFVLVCSVLNSNSFITPSSALRNVQRVFQSPMSWVAEKRSILSFIGCDLTRIPSIPVSANIIEKGWRRWRRMGESYNNYYIYVPMQVPFTKQSTRGLDLF